MSWLGIIMSPGKETELRKTIQGPLYMIMKSLQIRCIVTDILCDDSAGHHDFKNQLKRHKDG